MFYKPQKVRKTYKPCLPHINVVRKKISIQKVEFHILFWHLSQQSKLTIYPVKDWKIYILIWKTCITIWKNLYPDFKNLFHKVKNYTDFIF
jgi:hypothetical protein